MDRNWVEGAGTSEIVSRFESMEVQLEDKKEQNQKLREALEEIVECDPSYTNPTDIAQQALDDVESEQ